MIIPVRSFSRTRTLSPEELELRAKIDNHYYHLETRRKFLSEFEIWKNKNQRIVEQMINKNISEITPRDALFLGFIPENINKKLMKEFLGEKP